MELLQVPSSKKSEMIRGRVSTVDVRPSKLNSDKTISMMFDASNVDNTRLI